MRSELVIRFDYGQVVPWVRTDRRPDGGDRRPGRARLPHAGRDARRGADDRLGVLARAGQRASRSCSPGSPRTKSLRRAESTPRRPSATPRTTGATGPRACTHHGDYHDEITHSLLVLKALTYAPDRRHRRGADHVAAGAARRRPQLGLPLLLAPRRDAHALTACSRRATATRRCGWRQWLLRAVAGDPADVQIMYGIAGERRLDERELDWLPGYEDSTPVRVGNAASEQLQLDVYGEVLDALYQTRRPRRSGRRQHLGADRAKLLEWLEDGWRSVDAGIWEVRGPARHFTHSKVMAWVAFDRAVRVARGVRTGRAGRALAGSSATRSTPRCCASRWSDAEAVLRPVVRLRRARREPPAACRWSASSARPTRGSSPPSRRSAAS